MKSRTLIDAKPIIDDVLYVGGSKASKDYKGLKATGITHIVCLAGKQHFPGSFVYHKAHIADGRMSCVKEILPSTFDFIDRALSSSRAKVLVHCLGGISRSVAITIGYMMYSKGLSLEDAYCLVKRKKPNARPNDAFLRDLVLYHHQDEEDRSLIDDEQWIHQRIAEVKRAVKRM